MHCRAAGQWFQSDGGLYQNWMRDYEPTTGRYLQGDPLGPVDGASVYGYALQNPVRYVDPRGEFVPLAPIIIGAGVGMGVGYLFDLCFGDGHYTWQEALTDAAFGAAGAGLGARYAWRFGPQSLTRQTGREWSHSITRKTINRWAKNARDAVNKKSNQYPWMASAANRAINKLQKSANKRGGWNGSWTKPKRHYKHDPNRYPPSWRGMGDRYDPRLQSLDRIPDWIKLTVGGSIGASIGGNALTEAFE